MSSSDTISLLLAAGILTVGGFSLFMMKQNDSEEEEFKQEEEPEPNHKEDIWDYDFDKDSTIDYMDMALVQKRKPVPKKPRRQTKRKY